METPPPPDTETPPPSGVVWIKRFGVLGFLFFLTKGLMWLALPALLVSLGASC